MFLCVNAVVYLGAPSVENEFGATQASRCEQRSCGRREFGQENMLTIGRFIKADPSSSSSISQPVFCVWFFFKHNFCSLNSIQGLKRNWLNNIHRMEEEKNQNVWTTERFFSLGCLRFDYSLFDRYFFSFLLSLLWRGLAVWIFWHFARRIPYLLYLLISTRPAERLDRCTGLVVWCHCKLSLYSWHDLRTVRSINKNKCV